MNKTRSRKGFTLAELLVAMVIASMASAVTLRSLAFSLQYYQTRSEDTSAYLLCETVSLLVQDELTNKAFDANTTYTCTDGIAPSIDNVTLPKPCYGFGNTDAKSRRVEITVTPRQSEKYYDVTVSVTGSSGVMAAKNDFTVTPLG